MRQVWSCRSANPDSWLLFYGPHPAGEVFWIRALKHPVLTMNRIVDGLNGVSPQPARTWSLGGEGTPGRFVLLHNGVEVGELAWSRPDMRNPGFWSGRAVDGLNRVISRESPNPEPLPAAPVEQRQVA